MIATEPQATTMTTEAQPDTDPVSRLADLIAERRDIEAAIEAAGEADDEELVIRLLARRQVLPGRIGRAIIPALESEIATFAATIERLDAETTEVAAELPAAQGAVAAAEAALEAAQRALAAIHGRIAVPQRERSTAIVHARECGAELDRQRHGTQRGPSPVSVGTLREGVLALVDLAGPRGPRPLPSPRLTVLGNPHAEIPNRPPAPAPVPVAGPSREVLPGNLLPAADPAGRPAGSLMGARVAAPEPSARWIGGPPTAAEDEPLPA